MQVRLDKVALVSLHTNVHLRPVREEGKLMARSNKARYGMRCKFWKDTVFASRSQKKAWSSRKKIETRISRHRLKASLEKELAGG